MTRLEADNVLISVPRLTRDGDVPIVMLRATYNDSLLESGLTPITICPRLDETTVKRLYAKCSAVVFTGGVDWNPETYGQKPHPKTQTPDDARDRLELMLFGMALNDKKPIVAICRGAQGLAIACSRLASTKPAESVLHQHLPDLTPVPHAVTSYDALFCNSHEVRLFPNCLAREIFGMDTITIASGHHQGINAKALSNTPVLVSGLSAVDEVVEMIEVHANQGHFCIGIQGHPEVSPLRRKPLFNQLRVAATQYASRASM